jgi:carbamoylphosphate synthase large subunit
VHSFEFHVKLFVFYAKWWTSVKPFLAFFNIYSASFKPTSNYVVTKVPRFAFEKFTQTDPMLNTQMKSVGEAMAIRRTFKESLQKALRFLEIGRWFLTQIKNSSILRKN